MKQKRAINNKQPNTKLQPKNEILVNKVLKLKFCMQLRNVLI